jgi:hypothetical protein
MIMQRLARWHIWLGWLAAIPLLLWTISGIVMTLRPIEEVRGGSVRAEPEPIAPASLVFPRLAEPIDRAVLVSQAGRPVWVVTLRDEKMARYEARGATALGPVSGGEARTLADAAYSGTAALVGVRRFGAEAPPLDLRRPRPSWQAAYADGTHVYIDADSGEVLALRTRWWRTYDFMWGLHILDPMGREDTSHPLLWLFGAVGLISSLFGSILLFHRRKART